MNAGAPDLETKELADGTKDHYRDPAQGTSRLRAVPRRNSCPMPSWPPTPCGGKPLERPRPEYVAARGVLLDALTALGGHRDSLNLVGAQAVYHHAGSADLNVPLMTIDADLAIDVAGLADVPELGGAPATGSRPATSPSS